MKNEMVEIGKKYILKNGIVVMPINAYGTAKVVDVPKGVDLLDFSIGNSISFLTTGNGWFGGAHGKEFDFDSEVIHRDDVEKMIKDSPEKLLKFLLKGIQQMVEEVAGEKADEEVAEKEYLEDEKINLDDYHYEVEVVDGEEGCDNEGEKLFKVSVVEDDDGEVYDVSFAEHLHDAVAEIDKDVRGIFPVWFGEDIKIGYNTAHIIEKSDEYVVAISRSGHKYMLCNVVGCDCEGIQVIPKDE